MKKNIVALSSHIAVLLAVILTVGIVGSIAAAKSGSEGAN